MPTEEKVNMCKTCDRIFTKPDENNACPFCKSKNWMRLEFAEVYALDEEMVDQTPEVNKNDYP